MRKLAAIVGTVAVIGLGTVGSAEAKPSCNWGKLTKEAIAAGFPQGPHASDPSGDGPAGADQPRAGLGNVVEQGNLNATCQLIAGLLPD